MPAGTLRLIDSGALDPALNMALDASLLAAGVVPTLRLYGWSPPGLSLGWFQSAAAFDRVRGDHVVVRRVTGGGAIYHDAELTFALTGPATLLPGAIADGYRALHAAIAVELEHVGVSARRCGGAPPEPASRASAWCFAAPGCDDLVARDGRKILGSAQRRLRRPTERLLHHGSLVLRAPAATPSSGSLADWLAPDTPVERLADAIVAAVARTVGLDPVRGELEPPELARAERAVARERDPAWVRQR